MYTHVSCRCEQNEQQRAACTLAKLLLAVSPLATEGMMDPEWSQCPDCRLHKGTPPSGLVRFRISRSPHRCTGCPVSTAFLQRQEESGMTEELSPQQTLAGYFGVYDRALPDIQKYLESWHIPQGRRVQQNE